MHHHIAAVIKVIGLEVLLIILTLPTPESGISKHFRIVMSILPSRLIKILLGLLARFIKARKVIAQTMQ